MIYVTEPPDQNDRASYVEKQCENWNIPLLQQDQVKLSPRQLNNFIVDDKYKVGFSTQTISVFVFDRFSHI